MSSELTTIFKFFSLPLPSALFGDAKTFFTLSLFGFALTSVGLWMTGTCSGGEVGGSGFSNKLLPSSTEGASHSVTTSTSSSDGRSTLVTFVGGGSTGRWTFCSITPGDVKTCTFTMKHGNLDLEKKIFGPKAQKCNAPLSIWVLIQHVMDNVKGHEKWK